MVYLAVSAYTVSASSCLWMLCHLVRLAGKAQITHRAIWAQLIALAVTDILWAGFSIVPFFCSVRSLKTCMDIYTWHQAFEYCACFIEVQIAAGFAMASFRCRWSVRSLFVLIIINFPLALLLSIHSVHSLTLRLDKDQQCQLEDQQVWCFIILGCCLSTFLLNLIGIIGTRRAPRPVLCRAAWRALSYTLSCCLTIGIKAVQNILAPENLTLSNACWCLLALNGFAHVLNYASQNAKARSRTQLDLSVGFRSSSASTHEYSITSDVSYAEHYFDFDIEVSRSFVGVSVSTNCDNMCVSEMPT